MPLSETGVLGSELPLETACRDAGNGLAAAVETFKKQNWKLDFWHSLAEKFTNIASTVQQTQGLA
jgi:hypothetical protein